MLWSTFKFEFMFTFQVIFVPRKANGVYKDFVIFLYLCQAAQLSWQRPVTCIIHLLQTAIKIKPLKCQQVRGALF